MGEARVRRLSHGPPGTTDRRPLPQAPRLRPECGPRRRLTTARCCHRCRALRRLRRRGAMAAPQRGDVVSSSPVASPLRLLCPHQVAAARANPAVSSYIQRGRTRRRRHVALVLVERSQAQHGEGALRSLGVALMRWIGRMMTSPTANTREPRLSWRDTRRSSRSTRTTVRAGIRRREFHIPFRRARVASSHVAVFFDLTALRTHDYYVR